MNNQYEVFWEPKKAFQKVFLDLKKAKKSIHIETFMFQTDKTGLELITILLDKAEQIPVRIIVDGYGLQGINKNIKKKIENSKIKLLIFNPKWQHINKFMIRKWFRALPYRNHRKLTIIDDEIAYVGGMNYHDSELEWHDLFTRIKGPIVDLLKKHAKEMMGIATKRKNSKRKINKKNTLYFKNNDCITRQIPLSRHRPLKKQLKKILRGAKKEVYLTTPYFIPDPQFHNLLRKTTKRGVKVKLLVPIQSDRTIADILTNVNLFLAYKEKIEIRLMAQMTHAKYIIADNKICSYGSANMDYQAFYNNYELNITTNNKKLITEIKERFQKNWETATPFAINTWDKRPRIRKIMEKILHPFSKYF